METLKQITNHNRCDFNFLQILKRDKNIKLIKFNLKIEKNKASNKKRAKETPPKKALKKYLKIPSIENIRFFI